MTSGAPGGAGRVGEDRLLDRLAPVAVAEEGVLVRLLRQDHRDRSTGLERRHEHALVPGADEDPGVLIVIGRDDLERDLLPRLHPRGQPDPRPPATSVLRSSRLRPCRSALAAAVSCRDRRRGRPGPRPPPARVRRRGGRRDPAGGGRAGARRSVRSSRRVTGPPAGASCAGGSRSPFLTWRRTIWPGAAWAASLNLLPRRW